jgi:hypothetical protein
MVETITPVVDGGRVRKWVLLLALHAAGATAAAAAFGALLAGAGALLDAPWGVGATAIGLAATVYLAHVLGVRVPVPQLRRQVPNWWRSFFPLPLASFLYGVGLGVGFFTYLSYGTLVVVSVAAVASGDPLVGALLLAPFGMVRGLSAAVAFRARTPDEGAALVDRLARSASRAGWRLAHGVVLLAVVVTSLAAFRDRAGLSDVGAMAAAILSVVFGAAAVLKLARRPAWRRSLASLRLPAWIETPARTGVPVAEVVIAVLPLLGYASTAGLAAFVTLVVFSAALVAARLRVGPKLGCGCFVGDRVRDYRYLLGRDAFLMAIAVVAWREGVDAPALASIGMPRGSDVLPAILVAAGVALAGWVGIRTLVTVRRGSVR